MYTCNNCSQLTSKKIGCDKCGYDGKKVVTKKETKVAESQQPEGVVVDYYGRVLVEADWLQCIDDSEHELDCGDMFLKKRQNMKVHSFPDEQKDPKNPMIYVYLESEEQLKLFLASRFARLERPPLSPLLDADVQSFGL